MTKALPRQPLAFRNKFLKPPWGADRAPNKANSRPVALGFEAAANRRLKSCTLGISRILLISDTGALTFFESADVNCPPQGSGTGKAMQ